MCGLSPRVRGKRCVHLAGWRIAGSIPACAGEASPGHTPSLSTTVYPRVCGGSEGLVCPYPDAAGLSPRVRGKRPCKRQSPTAPRSIPACAGEAAVAVILTILTTVYPRVCGGSRPVAPSSAPSSGLSPRVRGKRCRPPPGHRFPRSIPACAGEAPALREPPPPSWVYPRVCGGSLPKVAPAPM